MLPKRADRDAEPGAVWEELKVFAAGSPGRASKPRPAPAGTRLSPVASPGGAAGDARLEETFLQSLAQAPLAVSGLGKAASSVEGCSTDVPSSVREIPSPESPHSFAEAEAAVGGAEAEGGSEERQIEDNPISFTLSCSALPGLSQQDGADRSLAGPAERSQPAEGVMQPAPAPGEDSGAVRQTDIKDPNEFSSPSRQASAAGARRACCASSKGPAALGGLPRRAGGAARGSLESVATELSLDPEECSLPSRQASALGGRRTSEASAKAPAAGEEGAEAGGRGSPPASEGTPAAEAVEAAARPLEPVAGVDTHEESPATADNGAAATAEGFAGLAAAAAGEAVELPRSATAASSAEGETWDAAFEEATFEDVAGQSDAPVSSPTRPLVGVAAGSLAAAAASPEEGECEEDNYDDESYESYASEEFDSYEATGGSGTGMFEGSNSW